MYPEAPARELRDTCNADGYTRRAVVRAASVTAGTVLTQGTQWAQSGRADAATFPKIHPQFTITPDQAWDWNVFKTQGGPTYAGSTGWKRFTDFLISKMPEFGAVDKFGNVFAGEPRPRVLRKYVKVR